LKCCQSAVVFIERPGPFSLKTKTINLETQRDEAATKDKTFCTTEARRHGGKR